jgi:hypothetical protein
MHATRGCGAGPGLSRANPTTRGGREGGGKLHRRRTAAVGSLMPAVEGRGRGEAGSGPSSSRHRRPSFASGLPWRAAGDGERRTRAPRRRAPRAARIEGGGGRLCSSSMVDSPPLNKENTGRAHQARRVGPPVRRRENQRGCPQWRSQELYMEEAGQSNMYRHILYYKF